MIHWLHQYVIKATTD